MMASSRKIEINVISAEDLLVNRRQPLKKKSFVVIKTGPTNSQSTDMDQEGGSYPAWNHKLVMELPSAARFLTVEVHSGSKIIGSANISVSDFTGGYLPENYLSFLSYRLRDANGDKNGIINLSVMVKGGSSGGDMGCAASSTRRPWVFEQNNKVSGRMAMGIPVPYRY